MFKLENSSDLLRNVYTVLQGHTTLTPGPSLQKLLKKARIEEVSPPTQSELNAYLKSYSSKTSGMNTKVTKNRNQSIAAPAAGGSWWTSFYTTMTSNRTIHLSLFLIAVNAAADLRRYANGEHDTVSDAFLANSSMTVSFLTGLLFEIPFYTREARLAELQQEAAAAEEAEAARAREELDRARYERERTRAISRGMIDIRSIVPDDNIQINTGEYDPISFENYRNGDRVVVISDDPTHHFLVDALDKWIFQQFHTNPDTNPTNPLTRGPFTLENLTVRTVVLQNGNGQNGGKRRKTRKSKKSRKTRGKRS